MYIITGRRNWGKTVYSVDGLFEWDEEKTGINLKKHGLSFQEAIEVFKDPRRLEYLDEAHSSEEELRFLTIGKLLFGATIAIVVSTDRSGATRIISARYANKKEERLYYENN